MSRHVIFAKGSTYGSRNRNDYLIVISPATDEVRELIHSGMISSSNAQALVEAGYDVHKRKRGEFGRYAEATFNPVIPRRKKK